MLWSGLRFLDEISFYPTYTTVSSGGRYNIYDSKEPSLGKMNYTDTTLKEIQLSRYIHVTKNVKQRNLHKLHTLVPKGSPMKEQPQQLFPWDRHITRRKKTQSWWGLL